MVAVLDPSGLTGFRKGPFRYSAEDGRFYLLAEDGAVPADGAPRGLMTLDDADLTPIGADHFTLRSGRVDIERPASPAPVGTNAFEGQISGIHWPGTVAIAGPAGMTPTRARLDLDFVSGALDPRITFTRASSATRVNADGLIELVGNNAPRFDHDPVTQAPRGLLFEDSRTNLFLNALLNGTSLSTQSVTVTAQAYTISFYGAGSITLSGAHSAVISGTGAYPARTTYTFTPAGGTLTCTVSGSVQFAQCEAGSFATSFIPTAASAVTRAADSSVMTGSNFSDWFNPEEGTFIVEAEIAALSAGYPGLIVLSDGTANNRLGLYLDASLKSIAAHQRVAGVLKFATSPNNSLLAPTRFKVAMCYSSAALRLCLNGGPIYSVATGALPAGLDRKQIGYIDSRLGGWIARDRYIPHEISDADMQEMTA